MIRWLDFNDTWLAAEWGHPSDNLGGILAAADWLSRTQRVAAPGAPLTMRDVLTAMIKAHEIQGVLALENSFNRVGLDHVVLVKVARPRSSRRCSACRARRSSTRSRTPGSTASRCAPTAMRPTPARARAGRRATPPAARVRLALIAKTGEMGYPSVLTAKTWGFYDVLFKGKAVHVPAPVRQLRDGERAVQDQLPGRVPRADGGRMRMQLHPKVADRLDDIESIMIRTHESAIRIIDKKGPLDNPADRDHCIQYMVAVPADLRPADRGRLRGRRRRRPAHRRAAREDGLRRGPAVHARLPRSREALDRQRHHGRVQRRREPAKSSSSIRSATRRRRDEGIPCWSRSSGPTSRACSRPSSSRRSSTSRSTRNAGGDPGERVRRPDGGLMLKVLRRPRAGGDPHCLSRHRRWVPGCAGTTVLVIALTLPAAEPADSASGLWEV